MNRQEERRKVREMDKPKTREIDASNMNQEQVLRSICDAIELNMQLGIKEIDVSYDKDGNITVQPKQKQEQGQEEK
jgi:hypothetical protein